MFNRKNTTLFMAILLFIALISIVICSELANPRYSNQSKELVTYTIIHKTCSGKLQSIYENCSNIELFGNGLQLTKSNGKKTMLFGGLTIIDEEPNKGDL